MGNIMDKIMNVMGMGEEEEQEFDTPIVPARAEEEQPAVTFGASNKKGKVVNIHTTTQLKVVVIQPITYSDAQEIADHLKSKKPVVVNLEKVEKDTAKKIVDFLSGAVYALDGSMQKVSNGILLIAPYNVGIMGDFSNELKTKGAFDLD
ncbi:MAG: cell division protein SepF [Ruminococcaceae bacterium]|nr:cell division protein SepF [Oscillospiraceae bacterium]